MQQDFLKNVATAVDAVRRHNSQQLGTHALCYQVRNLLKQYASLTDDDLNTLSPVALGEHLRELIVTVIDNMQPATAEDANSAPWRHYIILKDYVVIGRNWSDVADRLSVARARFYDYRKLAITALATSLARLERERARGGL